MTRSVFPVGFEITIRDCTREDLTSLEWHGLFTPHREIIHEAFERQRHGEMLMLVATANGDCVGQAWIDLVKEKRNSAGVLWAVRVIPWLRGLGIGRRLLNAGEDAIHAHGLRFAELGVEKHNKRAIRLYERLGYLPAGEISEEYDYTTPDGDYHRVDVHQRVLRKKLGPRVVARAVAGSAEAR